MSLFIFLSSLALSSNSTESSIWHILCSCKCGVTAPLVFGLLPVTLLVSVYVGNPLPLSLSVSEEDAFYVLMFAMIILSIEVWSVASATEFSINISGLTVMLYKFFSFWDCSILERYIPLIPFLYWFSTDFPLFARIYRLLDASMRFV